MPNDDDRNIEKVKESIGMDDQKTDNPSSYEEQMEKAKEEDIDDLGVERDDCDQEEPMTKERAIHMMDKIFPIKLGSRVRNKHQEDGIVEMVGVDFRGVLYLVAYQGHESSWESEHTIKVLDRFGSDKEISDMRETVAKTDIPQPDKKSDFSPPEVA